ncbi:hypothetical protein [Pseudomonas moorei]|uniref:hypothetical protein n=1 Tax=Pseudomonas moorei TaxID=395599 RepID=UPI00200FB76D|nr:hypothetical protein [Pseudomonas moorei]
MANKKGMHVCLLATLPVPGFYAQVDNTETADTINNLRYLAPAPHLLDQCAPKLHTAAHFPANARFDLHCSDFRSNGNWVFDIQNHPHAPSVWVAAKPAKPGLIPLMPSSNRVDRD